jgi:integrase
MDRREEGQKMEENVTVLDQKQKLDLKPTEQEGLKVGIMKNGRKYTVRNFRHRFFYPQEWIEFMNQIRPEKQHIYDVLINTGCRINEGLHIRPKDFDWDRNTLTLTYTKAKAKKGEIKGMGKPRTFKISSQFARRMRKYINDNNIQEGEFLFKVSQKAVYLMFKRALKKSSIKDPYNFSLHNIRKTHGNYLKALMRFNPTITGSEICLRLGHDMNTFLKHYGSSNIFDQRDINLMIKILGDLYGLR